MAFAFDANGYAVDAAEVNFAIPNMELIEDSARLGYEPPGGAFFAFNDRELHWAVTHFGNEVSLPESSGAIVEIDFICMEPGEQELVVEDFSFGLPDGTELLHGCVEGARIACN